MTLDDLKATCELCEKCGLHAQRTQVVFGVGDAQADILFVGEGPGKEEDAKGLPFVGAAGQLLDLYLDAFDWSRSTVYIANIVKCRPPNNRDPLPEEVEACLPWLEQQIKLIAPKLIVCLGRIAASVLIKPDFRITREHGQWFDRDGIPIIATLHPAALLRDPRRKVDSFEDFKIIQARHIELTQHE